MATGPPGLDNCPVAMPSIQVCQVDHQIQPSYSEICQYYLTKTTMTTTNKMTFIFNFRGNLILLKIYLKNYPNLSQQ